MLLDSENFHRPAMYMKYIRINPENVEYRKKGFVKGLDYI